MTETSTTKRPRRVYLITHPRVASNLLVKILNIREQNVPSSDKGGYFFQTPFLKSIDLKLRHKPVTAWTEDELSVMRGLYEKSFSYLQKWLEEAEENSRIAFIKEHALFMADPVSLTAYGASKNTNGGRPDGIDTGSTLRTQWKFGGTRCEAELPVPSPLNKTLLSDEFLLSFTPTFLIRHPALAFPSYLRAYAGEDIPKTDTEASAMAEEIDYAMTFYWIRNLYDFYASNGIEPLVLEADDVISSHGIVVDYARHVGFDAEKLLWNWSPADEKHPKVNGDGRVQRFMGTIMNSSGVMNDKMAKNLDIAVERTKWKEEFGGLIGEKMADWVEAAMEDYEFLKTKRLRPSST